MQGRGDFRCALLRPSSSVACQIDELVMKQEQKGKAWTKVKPARRGWWRTPLIPKLRKQRQVDLLWVWGQPDLYSEFQDIPNCIKRLYPKTNKQTKTTPTKKKKKQSLPQIQAKLPTEIPNISMHKLCYVWEFWMATWISSRLQRWVHAESLVLHHSSTFFLLAGSGRKRKISIRTQNLVWKFREC